MNYKYTFLLLVIATLSFHARTASAVEVGLGAVLQTGETSSAGVVVPIRLQVLTIEPEFSVYHSRRDTESDVVAGDSDSESRGMQALAGIYLRKAFGAALEGYYGGRVGIFTSTSESDNRAAGGLRIERSTDGLSLIPTFGLNYYFNKQFSMGVDTGLRIDQYTESEKFTNSSGTVTTDNETTGFQVGVESRIVVRAMF